VRRNEAFTASDESKQLRFLLTVNRDLAMAEEENSIHVAEAGPATCRCPVGLAGLIEDDVGIGTNEGVPQSGLVPESFDDRERVRSRGMLCLAVSRVGPGKKCFPHPWRRASAAATLGGARLRSGPRSGRLLRCSC
jgi:hypothetical protein